MAKYKVDYHQSIVVEADSESDARSKGVRDMFEDGASTIHATAHELNDNDPDAIEFDRANGR